jgi:cold shock CspA family protein
MYARRSGIFMMHKGQLKMRGLVKTYHSERGYGFLKPAGGGGENVFFHISIWPTQSDPELGDEVEFDTVVDPKTGKTRAGAIRLVLERD